MGACKSGLIWVVITIKPWLKSGSLFVCLSRVGKGVWLVTVVRAVSSAPASQSGFSPWVFPQYVAHTQVRVCFEQRLSVSPSPSPFSHAPTRHCADALRPRTIFLPGRDWYHVILYKLKSSKGAWLMWLMKSTSTYNWNHIYVRTTTIDKILFATYVKRQSRAPNKNSLYNSGN